MRKDMTSGPIVPALVAFTVPLIFGNLLQLLYNAADSVIAGQYIGASALAAIGAAAPIMNLAVLFISGMCIGTGILVSVEYGAGDRARMEKQLSTILVSGLVFSLAVMLAMLPLAEAVLRLTKVDENVIADAALYLRIIFLSLPLTFLYNFFSSALRAMGDSRTPLMFLALSSAANIVMDVVFIRVFHWGVGGSAAATGIAQAVSVLACCVYIRKKVPALRLGRRWLVFERSMFRSTLSYGFTSAMQQACLQMGKILIQSQVNALGVASTAAFAAVNRVDDFAYTPEQNIAHAMSTFLAQNRGAGKEDRIRAGFRGGLKLEVGYALILGAVFFLAAKPLVGMFVSREDLLREEVVRLGAGYLSLSSLMYLLPAFTNGIQGWFRGMGEMKITLFSTFMNMVGRVAAVYALAAAGMEVSSFAWANLAGWVLMLLAEVPILVSRWRRPFSAAKEK